MLSAAETELWNKFEKSGLIADYLNYVKGISSDQEESYASNLEWTGFEAETTAQRRQQNDIYIN